MPLIPDQFTRPHLKNSDRPYYLASSRDITSLVPSEKKNEKIFTPVPGQDTQKYSVICDLGKIIFYDTFIGHCHDLFVRSLIFRCAYHE